MADRSPAFNPPMNSLPADKDSQIVRVDLKNVDWAFRKSQTPDGGMAATEMSVVHVKQGS